MSLSPLGPGIPASEAMTGGDALTANLAKNAQKLEGQAALALIASAAQVDIPVSNPVGSTGSAIGRHINISV